MGYCIFSPHIRKGEPWAFCKWQRQWKLLMMSISRKALKDSRSILLEHGVSFELLLCQVFGQMVNIMKLHYISKAYLLFSLFSALFLLPWKPLWPFPMVIHPMGHPFRKISSHYAEFEHSCALMMLMVIGCLMAQGQLGQRLIA